MAAGNSHIPLTLPNWDLSEVIPAKGLAVNDKDHLDSIIWVGASTSRDTTWPYSAYGPNIDLFAPGDFIHSARNDSDTSSLAEGGTRGGTSDVSHDIDNKTL
jgi:subtilisin family serine protease